MIQHLRPNWPFIAAVIASVLVPLLYKATPYDPRAASSAIGLVAFVVLGFQFAAEYRRTPTTTRIAVVLIGVSLLLGAVASAQLSSRGGVALTYATYPLFGHRIACLLFAVYFHRLLDLETRTPWVKPRA